jgi:GrpB-like predicted nucleotidyltransferase (UPF0157 family)
MRIFRFDEELSVPVTSDGSLHRVAPLIGDGSGVRAEVIYLPSGGRIGRRRAERPQLFAVVAGSGWVSGEEERRYKIRTGYAARWSLGELHEAGSDLGMAAVCVEGDFGVIAFSVTRHIVVCEYDESWPDWFERLRQRIWPAVRDCALHIEHVGSTSVRGLAAKPIIDLDVVVDSDDDVRAAIGRLASLGYRWRGDLGVVGRQAFEPPTDVVLPTHHLYVVVDRNRAHLDHVLLRDLLRADPEARQRYAALKRANLARAGGDIDVYVAAKAAFVAELLTRARLEAGLPPVAYWEPELITE